MNRPTTRRSTRTLASLVVGALAALAGCATDTEGANEETAEVSQHLVGTWEWNDVTGTKCGNGSQTGFAINYGTKDDVVVYLEGGNYCWDTTTCNAGLASHFTTGYDGAKFASTTPRSGIFDRANALNPYKDSTIVYVPYCSGDFHSGDTVRGTNGTLHFNGRINLELDLAQLHSAVPNPSRVTLIGSSAGGYGALFNYWRVAQIFAPARVDAVIDSATVLWDSAVAFQGVSTWNTAAALPPGCPQCVTTKRNLYSYYASTYPSSRFAFVGFDLDQVMSLGYTVLPPLYREELRKLVSTTLKPLPNWKHFVAQAPDHTTMYDLTTSAQNNRCAWRFGICFPYSYGPTMNVGDWLTKMYTDDPTWAKQSALLE